LIATNEAHMTISGLEHIARASTPDLVPLSAARGAAQVEVQEHVPALDGVRAIAVLLVLAIHLRVIHAPGEELASLPSGYASWEQALFLLTGTGWLGVDLFFVLSGYLITGILLRSLGSPRYYAAFYARRVLRIFPLYYLLVLGFFAVQAARHAIPPPLAWYLSYLQNVQMALSGELGHPVLAVTWSLAVEEQFYLLWPLLVRAVGPHRLPGVCAALMVAAPLLRAFGCITLDEPVAAYVLMPARADSLAAGALVAALSFRGLSQHTRRFARVGLPVSAVVLVAVGVAQDGLVWQRSGSLILGISAAALMFASALALVVTDGRRASRWLAWAPLRAVGRHSYAMYLFHFPLSYGLSALWPMFGSAASVPAWWGTRWLAQGLYYLLAISVSYAAARLTWFAVEARALSLKRYFPY
jgi:peptidoglycan/LPS O-acetylase OafA/YrhL